VIERAAALLLLLLAAAPAAAEPVDDRKHMGVASCATGVCHGKLEEQADSNVWLNEYRIWSSEDQHAGAYQTLLTPESKAIARKLGLPSAHTAKICLDCHADNVPAAQRGPKFQLSDGVGCEACHGGAELWLETHTEPGTRHADNLAKGMLATEDINVRAEVCLSCHLGTGNQFATHQIMGAGHPRLSFELEAYTVNQPAHYGVDDDYVERKGQPSGFDVWRAGQLQSARRHLELLNTPLLREGVPDFAFFDCHSCHHPMDDLRWADERRQQGLEPGGLRLQDQHLYMLRAVASVLAPGELENLRRLQVSYLKAGQNSVPATRAAAAELARWIDSQPWTTGKASAAQAVAVRKAIGQMGANGTLTDFAAAEQAFLGIESLSYHIGDHGRLQGALDAVFATVETDRSYDPAKFRAAMTRLAGSL
jgi:Cytochrome c554 and c-prime